MICPGCGSELPPLSVKARLGTALAINLCPACRAIWFDRYEDLQLSPAATLQIFGIISGPSGAGAAPLPAVLHCPRCRGQLLETHDVQRNTPFQYWRCDAGHGRLMTFVDFLRAKDFVRPLTPKQLAELRQNVQTINCSNCGGAIDLGKDTVCAHCGSAVSMLDMKQMARTIGQLQAAAGRRAAAAAAGDPLEGVPGIPGVPGDPPREPTDIDALVAALRAARRESPPSLIEAGLGMLGDLLKKTLS